VIIKNKISFFVILVGLITSNCNSFQINAQEIVVIGKITDTLQNPLVYANILAIPKVNNQDVKFAITEKDGSYKLGLAKNQK